MNVTVPLDPKTLDFLDDLARRTERSRDELLAEAVHAYVDLQAWQMARIRQGIEEADRGDFASPEEVQRILNAYTSA